MSKLSTSGLHRTELGSAGPWVLLLHGLFGQGRNWTAIGKALADEHRVALVDLPDHGRSRWSEQVSYPGMAEAVADLIAEVAVVGHSMGGKVAMALALLHPDLVSRLGAVDIAPVRYDGLSSFADFVAGMRSVDLERLPDRDSAGAELRPFVPDPVVRAFLLQNLRRRLGEEAGWRWQLNLELLGDHLADLADWPDLDTEPYGGPVLWMAGAESDYITPAYGPAMRRLFPRTQLVTVKGSGHWLHAERPDIVLAALRRFLHPAPASLGNRV